MALVEETLFGTRDKVAIAIDFLREYEPPEGYYLAYSGGKDSTVILDLARKAGVKFDAHYNVTTADPPELVYFIREQEGIVWDRPEMSMWELIIHRGFPPMRHVRYCCGVLKERGGAGRRVLTGVRKAESNKRKYRPQIHTCYKDALKSYFHPIIYWSDEDVWEYIKTRELPYCSLYNEGFTRLGCICCPCASFTEKKKHIMRWPRYKTTYLVTFEKMLIERKRRGKETDLWKNAQDVWHYWIDPRTMPKKEDSQAGIFD